MNPAMMAGVMGATPASGAGAGTGDAAGQQLFDTSNRQQMMMALANALRQGGLGQQQGQAQQPVGPGQVQPVDTSQGLGKFANAMSALTLGPVKMDSGQMVNYWDK